MTHLGHDLYSNSFTTVPYENIIASYNNNSNENYNELLFYSTDISVFNSCLLLFYLLTLSFCFLQGTAIADLIIASREVTGMKNLNYIYHFSEAQNFS